MILGKERPNLTTRVSVGAGFLIWVYLISWHVLTLMSLVLYGSLQQAQLIEDAFLRVGSSLYEYPHTINRLLLYTIVELAAFTIILLGLILIYRRKRIGFLLYIGGNVAGVLSTLFILKLKYFQREVGYFDLTLIVAATAYFGIGALWFYKWKPKKKNENTLEQTPA